MGFKIDLKTVCYRCVPILNSWSHKERHKDKFVISCIMLLDLRRVLTRTCTLWIRTSFESLLETFLFSFNSFFAIA